MIKKICDKIFNKNFLSLIALMLLAPIDSIAEINPYIYDAYQKRQYSYNVDPYSVDLMGDKIDKFTGAIEFENIDVNIPGNSELEVQIRRKVNTVFSGLPLFDDETYNHPSAGYNGFTFKAGIVSFDIPRITYNNVPEKAFTGFSLLNGEYCSAKNFVLPGVSYEYNNGYSLIIPGKINEKLLINKDTLPESNSRFSTKSGWKLNCTDNEGFEAISPNGIKYTFDSHQKPIVIQQHLTALEYGPTSIDFNIFVTKVEDRFGNWVKYEYDHRFLEKISSNDGRVIEIKRTTDGAIVTANGKQWVYEKYGTKVTRPDGKFWEFKWFDNNSGAPIDIENGNGKNLKRYITPGANNGWPEGNKFKCKRYDYSNYLEVKHPDGAIGKFLIGESIQGDTNVNSGYYDYKMWISFSRCHSHPSIIKKSIQYSQNEEYTWEYEYSNNWGRYDTEILETYNYVRTKSTIINMASERSKIELSSDIYLPSDLNREDYKTVKTTNPDGSYIVDYIDRNQLSATYRKIVVTSHFDKKGKLLKEVKTEYDRIAPFGLELPGLEWSFRKYVLFEANMLVTSRKETLYDGKSSELGTYTNEYGDFNEYGFYTSLFQFNSFNDRKRYYKYGYEHDTTNWVLNKLSSIDISEDGNTYTEIENTSFYSNSGPYKGLPKCRFVYGEKVSCNQSYWIDTNYAGKLKKRIRNSDERWMEYFNYKRGMPQIIKRPANTGSGVSTFTTSIDNNGWIKSYTDFEGNCTEYHYDSMGRKTSIVPCDNRWDEINIEYSTTDGTEEFQHIKPGMFKQSVSRGDYFKVTYFDSLLRPRLIKEWDSRDTASTRYIRNDFDFENRITFHSKPHFNSNAPFGINTNYDSLGRKLIVNDNTHSGEITFEYLAGNRVKRTDAKGNVSTISYLTYSSPSKNKPTVIDVADGSTTAIDYNIHDNIKSIAQGESIEYRVYDTSQHLCKTIRADIGNTAYKINSLGEVQWIASGSSIDDSKDSCDYNVSNSEKIFYTYNELGNIESIDYGDQSPNKSFAYDNNSNIISIEAGDVIHNFEYNSANLLEMEELSIDGMVFTVDYAYNSLRHLKSISYPNGENIDFFPNALGQATKAGKYATNVTYHPNGTIKSFIFGNGIMHNTTLNSDGSGLPQRIHDYNRSTKAIDQNMRFDLNRNLEFLTDNVNSAYNLDLRYDALDRLDTIIESYNGSGYLTYDETGNIESYRLGNNNIDYHYDENSRLESTTGNYVTNFSYDKRGNVINNGRGQNMVYNLAQQLISGSTKNKILRFTYDGNDKRVLKNVDGKKTYFIYGKHGQLLHELREDGSDINNIYLSGKIIAKVEGWKPLPPKKDAGLSISFDRNIDLELGCPAENSFRYDEYCIDLANDYPIENYQPNLFEDFDKAVRISWSTKNTKKCFATVKSFRGFSPSNTKVIISIDDAISIRDLYVPVNPSLNYSVYVSCEGEVGFNGGSEMWIIENGEVREF